MLKSCMLVLLLCGCSPADPYMARFSQEQSARNLSAMEFCAGAVQAIQDPLSDEARDAICVGCLLKLRATI
jgi:hypothetical protein